MFYSWFDSLEWGKLENGELKSPILRPIQNNFDTQYFNLCAPEHDEPHEKFSSGWEQMFRDF